MLVFDHAILNELYVCNERWAHGGLDAITGDTGRLVGGTFTELAAQALGEAWDFSANNVVYILGAWVQLDETLVPQLCRDLDDLAELLEYTNKPQLLIDMEVTNPELWRLVQGDFIPTADAADAFYYSIHEEMLPVYAAALGVEEEIFIDLINFYDLYHPEDTFDELCFNSFMAMDCNWADTVTPVITALKELLAHEQCPRAGYALYYADKRDRLVALLDGV